MSHPHIRLLIVDDHPIVRDGLHRVQELNKRIRIVGEADSVKRSIELATQLRPDVILMDVRLPDGDGINAVRRIKQNLPDVHVLILTSYADNHLVLEAMEVGADGYLLKQSGAHRIVDAIEAILAGRTVFDPVVTTSGPDPANPLEELTTQEYRVLEQVAKGKTDKEVAMAIGLTAKTVRNYLDRIFVKIHVHTRTEAALLFVRYHDQHSDGFPAR